MWITCMVGHGTPRTGDRYWTVRTLLVGTVRPGVSILVEGDIVRHVRRRMWITCMVGHGTPR